ncbi:MAG: hypothetical protein ABFS46_19605 [Myxococcota bacterium]
MQVAQALQTARVPASVRRLLTTLRARGHAAHLVGGCVRSLAQGRHAADFDVVTDASPERVLALYPQAVPTGLRHGTVMVPTPHGPVDVTSYRAGPRLVDDLSRRDFTINAVAWDPLDGELVDPFGGLDDLDAGRLRCVGAADARLAEDPLRALRAARFLACLPLELDPELEAALPAAAPALAGVARERIRRELEGLLLGARAGAALRLLRRSGLEARIAPDTLEDAGQIVDALPQDLDLRLAGWLRGTRAGRTLGRLRFPRRRGERVERLLQLHPIEGRVDPARDASVRKLLSKLGDADCEALLELREAELLAAPDAAVSARLAALRESLERVRRSGLLALRRGDLALDGSAVMELLGTGPGPHVGRALRELTDHVLEDPEQNTPDALERLLRDWWANEQTRG